MKGEGLPGALDKNAAIKTGWEVMEESSLTGNIENKKEYANGYAIEVKPNKEKGFNFGYVLFVPESFQDERPLIVEGVNGGHQNNMSKAIESARSFADDLMKLGDDGEYVADVASSIGSPMMVPLFPRTNVNGESIYTHSLSSDTLKSNGGLERVDLQLLNMIEDVKERFMSSGREVDDEVILSGFSASADFVTRFAMLHPKGVKAVVAGGLGGEFCHYL